MRSKEFVGKAEGIKSHELSVKSLLENLKSTLSNLISRKNSLERRISSLYSELAAAESDTDEDGDPDYELIGFIENQIDQDNNELRVTESEISQTSGELERAEQEYEQVEEEKQQTLFEIQQRARTTSQNMSAAGGMYGAYADIGRSLNQSFQSSYDALAQAALILDGSVGVAGGGNGSKGTFTGRSGSGIVRGKIEALGQLGGINAIVSPKFYSGGFKSTQISGGHFVRGNLHSVTGSGISNRKASFHSGQTSLVGGSEGVPVISQAISKGKKRFFSSGQTSHFAGAKGISMATDSSEAGSLRIARKLSSEQASHREINRSKSIVGMKHIVSGRFTMNTPETIGIMREQMTDTGKKYFDQQINAGGGVAGQRAHLQGRGAEFYMTSTSADERASGNFLTREHPGATPQERKENLQLPTGNEAAIVEKVRSIKPAVVLTSKVAPQKKWAEESGYTAQEGMQQIFTPNKNLNGAIAAGIYEVIDSKDVKSIQKMDAPIQMDAPYALKKQAEQSSIQAKNSHFLEKTIVSSDTIDEQNIWINKEDFVVYSKEPEWQRLHQTAYPDSGVIGSLVGSSIAMQHLKDYMNFHNYGLDDYSIYSKDPEWQRLHRMAYLKSCDKIMYKFGHGAGESTSVTWSNKLRDRAQGFFSSFFSSSSGQTSTNVEEGDEVSRPINQILLEITSIEHHALSGNSVHQQFGDLKKIEVNNLSKEILSSITNIAVQNLRNRYGNIETSARFDNIGKKIYFINDKQVRRELGRYYRSNICGYYSPSSDTIRINMDGNATVGDIIATIDHEAMHLLSKHTKSQGGVLNANILDNNVGMNEGITEMLSIKNMQSINPDYVSNSYIDEVGIMRRFESICGEKELLDAYMKNDISRIEAEFNQLMGSRKAFEKFCNDIDILHRYNYVSPTDEWASVYRAEAKKRIFQKLDKYQAVKMRDTAIVALPLSTDKLQLQSGDSRFSTDTQLRFGYGRRPSTERAEFSASAFSSTQRDRRTSFVDELYGGRTLEQQAEDARKRRNATTSETSSNDDFYKEERQRLQYDDREI